MARCCLPSSSVGAESACVPPGSRWTFMGDSLMRYQYLDLVFALHFGNNSFAERTRRNPLQETTFSSWSDFYMSTHADLQPSEVLCDCYRSELGHYHFQANATVEVRVYHDWECNITLSYFQVFGAASLRLDMDAIAALPELIRTRRKGRGPLEAASFAGTRRIEMTWPTAIARAVAPMKPTVVILNTGLHASSASVDMVRLRSAAAAASPHVVWKTTTISGGSKRYDYSALDRRMWHDWTERAARRTFAKDIIFESRDATRGLHLSYWDVNQHHYTALSGAYRALNVALVQKLSALPLGRAKPKVRLRDGRK